MSEWMILPINMWMTKRQKEKIPDGIGKESLIEDHQTTKDSIGHSQDLDR